MPRVQRNYVNRFITIRSDDLRSLDKDGQEISDIIDSYGGSNPYPRLVADNGILIYSFTTKIPNNNIQEFDKELEESLIL